MPTPFAVGSIVMGLSKPIYLHPDLLFELQLDMEREKMLGIAKKLEQHLDLALKKLGSKLPLSLSLHAPAHAFTASFE